MQLIPNGSSSFSSRSSDGGTGNLCCEMHVKLVLCICFGMYATAPNIFLHCFGYYGLGPLARRSKSSTVGSFGGPCLSVHIS